MPIKLDSFNALEYLSSRGLIDRDDVISVESLGWGVSNTLVKVSTHQHCMVIKQSLPQLRVSEEWLADRERIFREWACIRTLCGILPDGTIPQVYHQDPENFLFVMSCAPAEGANWKEQLLAGQVSLGVAGKVGRVLAVIHSATAGDQAVRNRFIDDRAFVQLRIDPYHRTTAQVHPDVAGVINHEAQRMLEVKTVLVHGDYSPKNVIVTDGEIFLLDFEVVHYGNPVFDLAFMLNHLLLKSIHNSRIKVQYFEAARAFWKGYTDELLSAPNSGQGNSPTTDLVTLERHTIKQLGCLMLARVDGKSPAEYIVDPEQKEMARTVAKLLLLENLSTIEEAIELVDSHIADLCECP